MARANRLDIFVVVESWQGLLFDADNLADAVFGQLGATGMTLRIKADLACEAFTIDRDGRPMALRTAPGALFHPNPRRYSTTRFRPQTSSSLKTRDPAARLAQICRDRALKFRLRLSALCDATMAARHPESACRDALSLTSATNLCPANADVAEFVRCSLLDLDEQFQPDLIELEDYVWPDRYVPATAQPVWPIEPGPVETALLALCFCPSCQQRAVQADIDPASAMRSVQVHLLRWLREESVSQRALSDLLRDDTILSAYAACLKRVLEDAIRLWIRHCPNLALVLSALEAPWNPTPKTLADFAPRLIQPVGPASPAEVLGRIKGGLPDRIRLEATIDLAETPFADGPTIVRCFSDLANTAVSVISVENALTSGPSRWPYIRQAIRAARRARTA